MMEQKSISVEEGEEVEEVYEQWRGGGKKAMRQTADIHSASFLT